MSYKQFLFESVGNTLYRGINIHKKVEPGDILKPRPDRVAKDVPANLSAKVNQMLKAEDKPSRAEVLFVTTSSVQAAGYGFTYQVEPEEGAELWANPDVGDFFEHCEERCSDIKAQFLEDEDQHTDQMSDLVELAYKGWPKDFDVPRDIQDALGPWKVTHILEAADWHFSKLCREYVKGMHKFSMSNLPRGVEILCTGPVKVIKKV